MEDFALYVKELQKSVTLTQGYIYKRANFRFLTFFERFPLIPHKTSKTEF